MKINSQNQKDTHSNQNNVDNTSSKTMIEQIKEIQKSKDQRIHQREDEIIRQMKDKKLIK